MIVVFLTATNFFYLNFFPQFPRRCWSFWFHLSCGSFFFLPVLWRRLLCFIWCFFFSLSTFSSLLPNTFLLFDLHPHLYSVGWPHKRLHTQTHTYTLRWVHERVQCTLFIIHITLPRTNTSRAFGFVLFFILFCCVQFFSVQGVFQIHCTNICLHRWCVFPLVSPQHTHTQRALLKQALVTKGFPIGLKGSKVMQPWIEISETKKALPYHVGHHFQEMCLNVA